MKLLLILLSLIALLLTAGAALAEEAEPYTPAEHFATRRTNVEYGAIEYVKYFSTTTGTERKLKVLLPAGYDESRQYPVLYLLHGIGGDHNEWLGGKPEIVIGNLIALEGVPEMIVVFPNVRARADDAANPKDIYAPAHFAAFDNFIHDLQADLMPYMAAHYAIATGRENTAIAGLSMGGREALYIGLTLPETFGYVGAFCPAPGVLPYNVEPGLFRVEDFRAAQGMETFILINAGTRDGVVGDWPRTYSDTLAQNGTAHIFYITEGGHDFAVWKHGLYNFVKRIFQE